MPIFIAISNQKGGVAKTTTCVSLGAALNERGYNVLLVDLDPQANLSLALGVNPATVRRTVADVLMGSLSAADVRQATAVPGLDLLPASYQMRLVDRFLVARSNYEFALQTAIESAPYTFCLCDCPPNLGPLTLDALVAAHLTLIPTQCEPFALHGVREVIIYMYDQRQRLGLPFADYRVLVTMFDRRNRIHGQTLEQLRAEFGHSVTETMIEVDTQLRESQAAALPITWYASAGRSAAQYRQLADEVVTFFSPTLRSPRE
jgi:chromosome partitioning protein